MYKFARYVVGAGLVFGANVASAGDLRPETADSLMDACRSDYHRICPDVVPGDGRVARCLMDHDRELTPYCLQSLRTASAAEDCQADYQRFCRDVAKGPEAFRCLADRMERLEPSCRRVVAANAPYMQPRGDRYSSNEESAPAGPRPYADRPPYPYGAPYPGPYSYDGYSGPGEPRYKPNGGEPAQGEPRYGPRYRDAYGNWQSRIDPGSGDSDRYGERYAGEGATRVQPWEDDDERSYPRPGYDRGARPPY
jgi:Cysteine rich repeat